MSDITRSSMKMPCVVRMSGDLRARVAELAAREERSFSSMFRQLVRRGLDAGRESRRSTQSLAVRHRPGRKCRPDIGPENVTSRRGRR